MIALIASLLLTAAPVWDEPSGTWTSQGTIRVVTPVLNLSDDLVLQFVPKNGVGTYNGFIHEAPNPGDPTRNLQDFIFGYNCGKAGGAEVGGEVGVCQQMEPHWDDAGNFFRTEFHDIFLRRDGTQTRFISAEMKSFKDSLIDTIGLTFTADAVNYINPANNVRWLQMSSEALILTSTNGAIVKDVANVCAVKQFTTIPTPSYRCVSYIHDNWVELGDVNVAGVTANGPLRLSEQAEPATPPAGKVVQFIQSGTGRTCKKRSDASVKCLSEEAP